MADIIQIRRDTAANWTSANPTLAQGELGVETDTDKIKIGDGSTAWTSLGYLIDTGGYAPLASPTFTGTATMDGLTVEDGIITIGQESVYDAFVNSPESLYINIDSDNTQTGRKFQIGTNAANTSGAKIFTASDNGDISFYEDTGATPKFFWDASAEALGIGTSSPQYLGHFVNGDIAIVSTNTTNNAEKQSLLFGGASGGAAGLAGITGYRGSDAGVGELIFKTNQGSGITEAMRIDSSGNLLVGKTAIDSSVAGFEVDSDGKIAATRDASQVAIFNRLTDDGDIVTLRKDGTTVGSIGVNTNVLYIGGTEGTDAFIGFGNDIVRPVTSTGASRDNAIDLGYTGMRFKDLYLSGTAKVANVSETVYALSGTALNPANGGIQTKTLAANTTFTDALDSGESLVLQLEAGASYTVTWPTMQWVTSGGNVAPTLTAKDTLVFWKVSTTLYGAYTGSYV